MFVSDKISRFFDKTLKRVPKPYQAKQSIQQAQSQAAHVLQQQDHLIISTPKVFPIQHKGYKKLAEIDAKYMGKIHVYELDNGHKIFVIPNHEIPFIDFMTGFGTSLKNETSTTNGISHFIEHMIFKGSKKFPKNRQLDRFIEHNGATWNASTTHTLTGYPIFTPKSKFKKMLNLHADMLQNPLFPQKELQKEKEVVIEEIKGYLNKPLFTHKMAVMQNFSKGTMYATHPLGTEENIKNLSRQDLIDYYRNYAIPKNTSTIITGDIEPDKAARHMYKYFGKNRPRIQGKLLENKAELRQIPLHKKTDEIFFSPKIQGYGITEFLYTGPAPNNIRESLAMEFLSLLLGQMQTSRLIENLKHKQKIVTSIHSGFETLKDFSTFNILAQFNTKPTHNAEYIRTIKSDIKRELQEFITHPPTDQQVETIKNNIKRKLLTQNQDPDLLESLYSFFLTKEYKTIPHTLDLLQSITKEDIIRVAKKYLQEKPTIITTVPDKLKTELSFKGKLEPGYESSYLSNGIEVITKNKPESKLTSVSIAIKGGIAEHGRAKLELLEQLFNEKLTCQSPHNFKRYLEDHALQIEMRHNDNLIMISGQSFPEKRELLLTAIKDLLSEFKLEDGEFTHQKNDLLQFFDNTLKSDFKEEVTAKMYDHIYGPEDIRSRSLRKTILDLNNISKESLQETYRTFIKPLETKITIIGPDLSHQEMSRSLDQLMGHFQPVHSFYTKNFSPIKIDRPAKLHFPLTNSDQSIIMLAGNAPKLQSKNFIPFNAIRDILSLGLTSRLFSKLREGDEGLVYFSGAHHKQSLHDSLFFMRADTGVDSRKVNKILAILHNEVQDLKKGNITREELKKIKQMILTEQYKLKKDDLLQCMNVASHRALDKLSAEEYIRQTEKLSLRTVKQVAKKYFSQPFIEIVGAPQEVLENLRKIPFSRKI